MLTVDLIARMSRCILRAPSVAQLEVNLGVVHIYSLSSYVLLTVSIIHVCVLVNEFYLSMAGDAASQRAHNPTRLETIQEKGTVSIFFNAYLSH
jgi:hypothetical protein